MVIDKNGKPIVLKFDLVERSSPMIIGLDILQYANIDNTQGNLSFKRPTDISERSFSTFIAMDVNSN